MTDRKKLRELIGNVQDEGVSYVDCFSDTDKPEHISNDELARYLISRGVRLESKTSDKTSDSKWISVEDEMPHAEYGESDNVLAVDGFGIVKMLYFDGGCWCHPTGETVVYENPRWRITHWMPLPQPPGEE